MEKIKRFVRNHESLMYALAVIYRFCGLNRIKGKPGLKISWGGICFPFDDFQLWEEQCS